MKALTICQPYAFLIASGAKPIENRTWPTSYRGPLAIHAGKSRDWLESDDEGEGLFFGGVVAIAELVDCRRVTDLPAHLRDHEHANGPWCWILENVRVIDPVPYRGAQGLFDIPDDLLRAAPSAGETPDQEPR